MASNLKEGEYYYETSRRAIFDTYSDAVRTFAQDQQELYSRILNSNSLNAQIFTRYFFGEDNPSTTDLKAEFNVGTPIIRSAIHGILNLLWDSESFKTLEENLNKYTVIDLEGGKILPPKQLKPANYSKWKTLQEKLIENPDLFSSFGNLSGVSENNNNKDVSLKARNVLITKRYLLLEEHRTSNPLSLDKIANEFDLTRQAVLEVIKSVFYDLGLDYYNEDSDEKTLTRQANIKKKKEFGKARW